MNSDIRLIPPTLDQAEALADLTWRSKASWGYDFDFLEHIRADINITPEMIASDTFMTAVQDDRVLGYAHLMAVPQPDTVYLENLYVDADIRGRGIGRVLFTWAEMEATRQGYAWLEWDSDPNAAPFYRHMGGEQIGQQESNFRPGRWIPKFRKHLEPDTPLNR